MIPDSNPDSQAVSPDFNYYIMLPHTHRAAAREMLDVNSCLWEIKLLASSSSEIACKSRTPGLFPNCSHSCCLLHGPL